MVITAMSETLPGMESMLPPNGTSGDTAASTTAGTASSNAAGRFGASTERLYGRVHVPLDEFLDIIDEAVQVPGCVVMITRMDEATGQRRSLPPMPAESFDAAAMVRRFGPGEFYARVTRPGHKGAWRACKFILDAPLGEASRPQSSFSVGAPVPTAGAPVSAPPGPDLFGQAISLMTSMIAQQQAAMQAMQSNQTNLFTSMLQQKREPEGVGQLEVLLRLADRLNRRGGGSRESSGEGIGEIVKGVTSALLTQPVPAARPAAPRVIVQRKPQAAAPVQAATPALDTTPPATTPATEPQLPTAAPDACSASAAEHLSGPELSPELGLALMKLAPAESVMISMLQGGADPDRIADMVAAVLGDDLETLLDRCNPGELTALVAEHVPSLREYAKAIALVEKSLRECGEDGEQEDDET